MPQTETDGDGWMLWHLVNWWHCWNDLGTTCGCLPFLALSVVLEMVLVAVDLIGAAGTLAMVMVFAVVVLESTQTGHRRQERVERHACTYVRCVLRLLVFLLMSAKYRKVGIAHPTV